MKAGGILGGGPGNGAGTAPQGFVDTEAEDEVPNVDPDEQRAYEDFVKNGMGLIYTPEGDVHEKILARLSTGSKPMDTLAQTTVWLVTMLEQDARINKMELSDDVVFHGARELMEQLIEVDEAAGVHEFKEAEIQGAWYKALDMYREANSDEGGRVNPDEAKAAFQALQDADQEGRADEVLPGFYQKSERGIAAAMQDGAAIQEEDEVDGEAKVLNRKMAGKVSE